MNYYKCFMEEEPFNNDYTDLHKIGEEKFNKWFKENSIHFKIDAKKEIKPSVELLNQLNKKGFSPEASQCHYNSQMACLLHDGLDLCTGILINCNNEFYTHSFCLFENQVVDFSVRFFIKKEGIYGFNINNFPFEYFGIKISNEFLKENKNEIFENGYFTKPYLYEWYLETNQNENSKKY